VLYKNRFVLESQRNGERDLKAIVPQQTQDLKGSTTPGPERRHEYVAV